MSFFIIKRETITRIEIGNNYQICIKLLLQKIKEKERGMKIKRARIEMDCAGILKKILLIWYLSKSELYLSYNPPIYSDETASLQRRVTNHPIKLGNINFILLISSYIFSYLMVISEKRLCFSGWVLA